MKREEPQEAVGAATAADFAAVAALAPDLLVTVPPELLPTAALARAVRSQADMEETDETGAKASAAVAAVAAEEAVPEPGTVPWPKLTSVPTTTGKASSPVVAAAPRDFPWKMPPPQPSGSKRSFLEMHGVNEPPPAPAKREKATVTEAASSSEASQRYMDERRSTKLQSGWLCRAVAIAAAWETKSFERLDHLTRVFNGDPTFRSRLEDHVGYLSRHGQDPQYNY